MRARDVNGTAVARLAAVFAVIPVSREGADGRAGPSSRGGSLFGLAGYRGSLGNGKRESAKLASAGDTNTPCELRLVAGALVADLEALGAVRPPAVALDVAFCASKAVVGSTAGGGTTSTLADGGRLFDRDGLLREGGGHGVSSGVADIR